MLATLHGVAWCHGQVCRADKRHFGHQHDVLPSIPFAPARVPVPVSLVSLLCPTIFFPLRLVAAPPAARAGTCCRILHPVRPLWAPSVRPMASRWRRGRRGAARCSNDGRAPVDVRDMGQPESCALLAAPTRGHPRTAWRARHGRRGRLHRRGWSAFPRVVARTTSAIPPERHHPPAFLLERRLPVCSRPSSVLPPPPLFTHLSAPSPPLLPPVRHHAGPPSCQHPAAGGSGARPHCRGCRRPPCPWRPGHPLPSGVGRGRVHGAARAWWPHCLCRPCRRAHLFRPHPRGGPHVDGGGTGRGRDSLHQWVTPGGRNAVPRVAPIAPVPWVSRVPAVFAVATVAAVAGGGKDHPPAGAGGGALPPR